MTQDRNASIAASLDVTVDLLPFLNTLLADIWSLGSSPERIFELLQPLALSPDRMKVLDLGCGKGAVAVTLAQKLGLEVFGYDHYKPFLDEADGKARDYGVDQLCHFKLADIHDIIPVARDFDVVIYAAVGQVLGNLETCVDQLRQTVKPDGYMIIDDCFALSKAAAAPQGYEYLAPHEESVRQLTAHGDILLTELIVPKNEIKAYNLKNIETIERHAKALAGQYPEKADLFSRYVRQEQAECEFIERATESVVWLLQKKNR